jgi:TRAP-type mannitol/chloroaromatic compound transport system permease small subunit
MLKFVRTVDRITEWTGRALMWFPWLITAIIMWEIILRFVFNRPTIWAHELGLMVFGAVSMLAGAYAHKYRGHVNMDLFYARLSNRGKAILDLVTFPLFSIFCAILIWKGGVYAWRSIAVWEYSQSNWAPLIWPIKLIIPVGAALLFLQGLSNLISDVSSFVSGKGAGK